MMMYDYDYDIITSVRFVKKQWEVDRSSTKGAEGVASDSQTKLHSHQ